MQQYGKFKVGDKVKLLSTVTTVGVECEDVGKVGVISGIDEDVSQWYGFKVQMGEICKARGYRPEWCVGPDMVELYPRKNQQLLFNFMEG